MPKDKRNEVSDRALDTMKKVMYEQDDYGMDKYKEPLHHSYEYDWLQMALQEEADKLKYLQCEMDRKQRVISILSEGLILDENHREYMLEALKLLEAGGREKK